MTFLSHVLERLHGDQCVLSANTSGMASSCPASICVHDPGRRTCADDTDNPGPATVLQMRIRVYKNMKHNDFWSPPFQTFSSGAPIPTLQDILFFSFYMGVPK